jgi:hypothetical protein
LMKPKMDQLAMKTDKLVCVVSVMPGRTHTHTHLTRPAAQPPGPLGVMAWAQHV